MTKYHINPETGAPGICRADPSNPNSRGCRFKASEDEHYASKAEAEKAYEARMEAEADGSYDAARKAQAEERLDKIREKALREENSELDFDIIRHQLKWIRKWEEDWTDDDHYNLRLVQKLVQLTSEEDWNEDKEAQAERLLAEMRPAVERPYIRAPGSRGGWSTNDPSWNDSNARDQSLNGLAENLLRRRRMEELSHEPVEGELDNPRLLGLRAAQEAALQEAAYYRRYTGEVEVRMGKVEPHLQEAVSRVVRGDEWHGLAEGADHRSLLPVGERVFASMHPDAPGDLRNNQLYLATVFPVRELKAEMDRIGIDGVSVSTLDNGREQGNIYTVMTPDGSTRSFAVYEHRNTDSIIINGREDWNGEGLPYAGDNKNQFFAEFEEEDRVRAAQSLTFYLAAAQKGTLEEDAELVAKAQHRDWFAILDAQVPRFKAWRKERFGDDYIAPKDENEEDILKRLDFPSSAS